MKQKLIYTTCCVNSNADDIIEMRDKSREITYKTFIKYVSHKELLDMFCEGFEWKSIKNDYHIRYFKSTFKNHPCYYLKHSAIEYIWT
jgi:hypothetical protein